MDAQIGFHREESDNSVFLFARDETLQQQVLSDQQQVRHRGGRPRLPHTEIRRPPSGNLLGKQNTSFTMVYSDVKSAFFSKGQRLKVSFQRCDALSMQIL